MHRLKTAVRTLAAALMLAPLFSYAAPELFITWKAGSYVPAGYAGKALPTAGTPIDFAAILVDGGKAVSLAPYDLNWYAGEDRIVSGKGAATARAAAPATGQDSLEVRVNVGKYAGQPLDAFVTVPVVKPEIVIRKKAGGAARGFSAVPYFWNVLDPDGIAMAWEDGEDGVTVRATNKKNPLEFTVSSAPKQ